jgi:hypothetical protein
MTPFIFPLSKLKSWIWHLVLRKEFPSQAVAVTSTGQSLSHS